MKELSHFNKGGAAWMVDVADKPETHRIAVAAGRISMAAETLTLIRDGGHKKGDVLGIARIAGITAAKKTSDLVPLCHPLPLTRVEVDFQLFEDESVLACQARVETVARTGVEMEALCTVQNALLTVYDMCKAVDRGMCISAVRVLEKRGGRSGDWQWSGKD